MKYLYRILRLFFCPHNYVEFHRDAITRPIDGELCQIGYFFIKDCKYCGKIQYFRCKL